MNIAMIIHKGTTQVPTDRPHECDIDAAEEIEEELRLALKRGLEAHHFLRMTFSGRMGQIFSHEKENFECSCGSEFEDAESLAEHQALHLRVYMGVKERAIPKATEGE